jgi:hypothetical protein
VSGLIADGPFGWWQGTRNRYGRITVNRQQWPNGMAWLTYYIHSHGLKAGIYTDAGATGCRNAASYGHYQQDIDTFARCSRSATPLCPTRAST